MYSQAMLQVLIVRTRVRFTLKDGATGYLFRSLETGGALRASFNKSTENGIPMYDHRAQVPVVGVDETQKNLLKQLDNGNYFAAIQFKGDQVEIFGFNYGLTTGGYDFQAQSPIGGAYIPLQSTYKEYDPPLNLLAV